MISVIVPTFNYDAFIRQTLESVRAQTMSDWECIVVDDGSTDGTRSTVESLAAEDHRIRYVYQKHQGLSAARNTGWKQAVGEYLQFLDSDDLIEPEKLEKQSFFLNHHPEVDLIHGNVRFFGRASVPKRKCQEFGISGTGKPILICLISKNIPAVHSLLIRKSLANDIGLFDLQLVACEDWDYWLRCAALNKRFEYQPAAGTGALVRIHAGSMIHDRGRMLSSLVKVREKVECFLADKELSEINRKLLKVDRGRLAWHEFKRDYDVRRLVRVAEAFRWLRWRKKWLTDLENDS